MQFTDHVSSTWTLEIYMTLLTNVTPIHLIKNSLTDLKIKSI